MISLALASNAVDLWCTPLDVLPDGVDAACSVLSDDERRRAARYASQTEQRRFVVSRGMLRTLLARYTGIDPYDVPLAYSPHGKPRVPMAGAPEFSVSHSEDLAVYAVTRSRQVGVDIEGIRPRPDSMDIASAFFARSEISTLLAAPATEHTATFLACWTRKEAYLKARGEGLTVPLNSFSVSVPPEPPRLREAPSDGTASHWQLHAIPVPPGYVGTVAVEASRSERLVLVMRSCDASPAARVPSRGR